jgi:hypothetical protein
MEQAAHFCLYSPTGKRCSVGLFIGDVSRNTSGYIADLLIVSVFRGDYSRTSTSVIGALGSAGADVGKLRTGAEFIGKECWLSSELDPGIAERIGAARILCYEGGHTNPVESLQMTFAALLNAEVDKKIKLKTLVTPVLCGGDQKGHPDLMLQEILNAVTVSFEA